jgi:hypothetical protein
MTKIGLEQDVIDEGTEYLRKGQLESFEAHAREHVPMLKIDEMMKTMRKYRARENEELPVMLWEQCAKEYIPGKVVYVTLAVLVLKWLFIAAAVLGGVLYLWDRCAG